MKIHADTRHKIEGYIFILPFIIGFALFFLFPLMKSIGLSFSDVNKMIGLSDTTAVGFKHYITAFTGDVEFVPPYFSAVPKSMQIALAWPMCK